MFDELLKMQVPTVSVIVTCYNYGLYLEGCLDSILNQTFTDYEIIVINDGSTDNTDDIVKKFQHIKNIKYVKQLNGGQAKAKNTGIKYALGRFVAFLDADDEWEKDKLEKQMVLFLREAVGVVYSQCCHIDQRGMLRSNLIITEKYLIPRSGKVTNYLFLDNFVPFSSSVVRKACLQRCGGFDESLQMGIDWDLWLRISTIYEFDFVNEPLLKYRVGHMGQMSKNIELRHQCADRIMTRFLNLYPNFISPYFIRKAYSFTYYNRGEYYRFFDKKKAILYFLKSIVNNFREINSYKGLIKILFPFIDR
ncbi:MAG: glycosyltransferase [Candidatus Competibacteraceae bacterium]|nr:glycosyltransferase [Candidatus Competibacteraceae bacterium]